MDSTVETEQRMNPRIILLALGMFALGTDAFLVAGVLPVIARETGVSEGLVGQLITVFALTYGLGAPVLAATTAHWPRHRVLMGALGLLGLANLASALSPSFPLLLLSRILAGCFAATYMSILDLFCSVDDFWQQFAPQWQQELVTSDNASASV
jgi:MFS transporter, DHA1 family, inner membrane transport protein